MSTLQSHVLWVSPPSKETVFRWPAIAPGQLLPDNCSAAIYLAQLLSGNCSRAANLRSRMARVDHDAARVTGSVSLVFARVKPASLSHTPSAQPSTTAPIMPGPRPERQRRASAGRRASRRAPQQPGPPRPPLRPHRPQSSGPPAGTNLPTWDVIPRASTR